MSSIQSSDLTVQLCIQSTVQIRNSILNIMEWVSQQDIQIDNLVNDKASGKMIVHTPGSMRSHIW